MIVITGAAGFIGSRMVQHLNESDRNDLVLVDDFPVTPVEPGRNVPEIYPFTPVETCHDAPKMYPCIPAETCCGASLQGEDASSQTLQFVEKIPRDFFFDWAVQNIAHIDFILHFGIETAGMQADAALLREYNLEFSQRLWSLAAMNRIPMLYAAASTEAKWNWTGQEWTGWGSGTAEAERLKRQFDQWVLKQRVTPPLWAGFAMPEVYGPNEESVDTAASSVFQLFKQWQKEGRMLIPVFENSESSDNEPLRDRIFVKDVVTVFTWFINHLPASGFYYLGNGFPRPLSTVANAIFSVLKLSSKVEYQVISSSEILHQQEKNTVSLSKINRVGYKKSFTPLEKGIRLCVKNYLSTNFY